MSIGRAVSDSRFKEWELICHQYKEGRTVTLNEDVWEVLSVTLAEIRRLKEQDISSYVHKNKHLRKENAELDVEVERLKRIEEAAKNICHWHDWGRDNEGMVVSSKHVFKLWEVLGKRAYRNGY